MRHRKDGRKLGRTASHRKAMLANMAANLFLHKQIRTTHPKALEARRLAETLISKAKQGDIHSRRLVLKVIQQKDVVKILFDEIAPQYAEREGGYTRITKLGQRKNDAAAVSLLSLVDFDPTGAVSKASSKKEKKQKESTPVVEPVKAEAVKTVEAETVGELVAEVPESKEEIRAEMIEEVPATSAEEPEILEEVAPDSEESESEAEKS